MVLELKILYHAPLMRNAWDCLLQNVTCPIKRIQMCA